MFTIILLIILGLALVFIGGFAWLAYGIALCEEAREELEDTHY